MPNQKYIKAAQKLSKNMDKKFLNSKGAKNAAEKGINEGLE